MAKVLFIKASPLADTASRSTQVANTFVKAYQEKNPADEVITLDLYKMNIPLIDLDLLTAGADLRAGKDFEELEKPLQEKLTEFNALTDQFVDADKYIIASPLWNLGVPPLLKAYIDTIVVAGKTFKYTEKGPIGLLKNKKAIQIHGSGGVYSNMDVNFSHGEPYLNTVLNFIGVKTEPTIFIEGVDHDPSKKDEIVAAAEKLAYESAQKF
ncbi:FMN-dependent NADH-azoreductase [Listeria sp. PSOL-1]|uniref:FMN-dependent NADH-azoreductase n=1 Tax=Listeria sp. PSOL-1 TaxID=1844999 RepID=UPI0013D0FD38|nr:FMN-dependent NADH-azoreductase [Listeria sp. PSOL-1]